MEQNKLAVNQIISMLTKSPHGDLKEYLQLGIRGATEQPEFFAHLIAWNARKGQVHDSKKALPIVSLCAGNIHPDFVENAKAHLLDLNPRDLLAAYKFALDVRPKGHMKSLKKLLGVYIDDLESDHRTWDRTALTHRDSIQRLYALAHRARDRYKGVVLFRGEGSTRRHVEKTKISIPPFSKFASLANLSNMSPEDAASVIITRQLPYLNTTGALGDKVKHPDVMLAHLSVMTPNQIQTMAKTFERRGVMNYPATKAAFEEALSKLAKSGKNTLKTAQAIQAVESVAVKEKLRAAQESQIQMKGVEGNWLVLGDASPSMAACIDKARYVAAVLAKMVKGNVRLTFFDSYPRSIDVTGLDYDKILEKTKHVQVSGSGTSIGCGLLQAIGDGFDMDGIAIVSDAEENTAPYFADQYKALCGVVGKDIPVYLYRMGGQWGGTFQDLDRTMKRAGCDLQEFGIDATTDYYSIMNMVQTMRCNRYSLYQEIMDTPLKKMEKSSVGTV